MIVALLKEADEDLAKSFDPEMSEDPEYSEETMMRMIKIANKYLVVMGEG